MTLKLKLLAIGRKLISLSMLLRLERKMMKKSLSLEQNFIGSETVSGKKGNFMLIQRCW
jgi:hypothetical protein